MVICLEQGADLHMAQLMPLPLTVSCFSNIQTGFTFLVPAHPGSPGLRAVKRVCVCVCCAALIKTNNQNNIYNRAVNNKTLQHYKACYSGAGSGREHHLSRQHAWRQYQAHIHAPKIVFLGGISSLQRFDAVGWAAVRASGL